MKKLALLALIAGLAAPCLATHTLTRREREILGYLRTTMTLTEIADELGLSINTIKTQVRSIYSKLDVRDRAEAGAVARALGLLQR